MADEVTLEVPVELDGERVDKTVSTLLNVSRAVTRTLFAFGVFVDDDQAKPSTRVRSGSTIRAPKPEVAVDLEAEELDFEVLYEDSELVVVDKPPGMVVHPGSGRRSGTLAAGLLYRFPDVRGVGQVDRWGLVHRLDKDTSGTLLVARTNESYAELVSQLRQRTISRQYMSLVRGLFASPTGAIEAPIGRDPNRPTRRAVVIGGKPARTRYEVMEQFESGRCSLVEARLDTGRTHQIRVHFAAIEHPVVGDKTYGSGPDPVFVPRIFLHASHLSFIHPVSKLQVSIAAELPQDLESVLAGLRAGSPG